MGKQFTKQVIDNTQNLNGQIYLGMLEYAISPVITETVEDQFCRDGNFLVDVAGVYFQEGGTPIPTMNFQTDEINGSGH